MLVLVADYIAVFVDAESLASLVPVAPGHARAVGLRVHVDEEVLHPLTTRARKRIPEPGNLVIQLGRPCQGDRGDDQRHEADGANRKRFSMMMCEQFRGLHEVTPANTHKAGLTWDSCAEILGSASRLILLTKLLGTRVENHDTLCSPQSLG